MTSSTRPPALKEILINRDHNPVLSRRREFFKRQRPQPKLGVLKNWTAISIYWEVQTSLCWIEPTAADGVFVSWYTRQILHLELIDVVNRIKHRTARPYHRR